MYEFGSLQGKKWFKPMIELENILVENQIEQMPIPALKSLLYHMKNTGMNSVTNIDKILDVASKRDVFSSPYITLQFLERL